MAIDFPNTPAEDEEFTVGATTWVHNSGKWTLKQTTESQGNVDGGHPDSIYTPLASVDAGGI